ncbi:MAG: P-loop NTPase, partial [Deinococcota bacterium]|nr:P-loop NTPase [Deinococcota bacterium]
LARFLLRGLPVALIVALLAGAAAYMLSGNVDRVYNARATLLVTNPAVSGFGASLVATPPLDLGAYRAALYSSPVFNDAAQAIREMEGGGQGLGRVVVRTEEARNSPLIHVDVTHPTGAGAANAANALAEALLRWERGLGSENLEAISAALREQISGLDEQMENLRQGANAASAEVQDQIGGLATLRAQRQAELSQISALSNSVVSRLRVLQPAPVPRQPAPLSTTRNAAIAVILGLLLSYGVMLVRATLDRRLKSSDDLAAATGLPVLAEFPRQAQKTYRLPREATSYLRTNLLSSTAGAHPKVVLVTSALAGEGKSSVALSLAASFAVNKHRTLLIDADLRKPVLGRVLNLNPILHHSLQKHLEHPHENQGRFTPASVSVSASEGLDIIPSFEPTASPAELLSYGFATCLKKWQESYDVIVIDSPPVLPVADALTIAPLCTGTVLVGSLKGTDRRQVQAAVDVLQLHAVRLLGVVATNLTEQGSRMYNYGYGEPETKPSLTALGADQVKRPKPKNLV